MKLYVPSDYINKPCINVYDKDTIRIYDTMPQVGSTSSYTDFFINSHYITRGGTQTWNQYTTNLPSCVVSTSLTDSVYYRNDITDILICLFIILIICFYFPYRILSRLFGRWLKW